MNGPLQGILCLDKPADMTSFSCCGVVRRLLGSVKSGVKIGHAGTLDPMATGVLPLLIGPATRTLDWLPAHDKRYTAVIRFGLTSDTQDIWGTATPTGAAIPSRAAVEEALAAFRGDIRQVPPMMSALKRDGVRLYDLARQGIEVEREARPVTIHRLTLCSYDAAQGEGIIDCLCSKGTYIRTLCADIGTRLGCGAVMAGLRRTMAAGFALEECITLDTARTLAADNHLADHLLPIDRVLDVYPPLTISSAQAVRFSNGGALDRQRLKTTAAADTVLRVYAPNGDFLGLGRLETDSLKPCRLFTSSRV